MDDSIEVYAIRNKLTGEWFEHAATPIFTRSLCRAQIFNDLDWAKREYNALGMGKYYSKPMKIAELKKAAEDSAIVKLTIKIEEVK